MIDLLFASPGVWWQSSSSEDTIYNERPGTSGKVQGWWEDYLDTKQIQDRSDIKGENNWKRTQSGQMMRARIFAGSSMHIREVSRHLRQIVVSFLPSASSFRFTQPQSRPMESMTSFCLGGLDMFPCWCHWLMSLVSTWTMEHLV